MLPQRTSVVTLERRAAPHRVTREVTESARRYCSHLFALPSEWVPAAGKPEEAATGPARASSGPCRPTSGTGCRGQGNEESGAPPPAGQLRGSEPSSRTLPI